MLRSAGTAIVSVEVKPESQTSTRPETVVERKTCPLGVEIVFISRDKVAQIRMVSEKIDF